MHNLRLLVRSFNKWKSPDCIIIDTTNTKANMFHLWKHNLIEQNEREYFENDGDYIDCLLKNSRNLEKSKKKRKSKDQTKKS